MKSAKKETIRQDAEQKNCTEKKLKNFKKVIDIKFFFWYKVKVS